MKYMTNKENSSQIMLYAFLGVKAKVLKISIFFIPLHYFLNHIHDVEERYTILNINQPLFYGTCFVLATSIIVQITITFRLKIRQLLSVDITDSLFNNGNLKHCNPQNSLTNAIISYEEHKVVVALYSFILSLLSYYFNAISIFILLPLLAYLYIRVLVNYVSSYVSYQRIFILTLNLFLLFYVYLGIFTIYQPGDLDTKISILIFHFFLFRFLVDAATKFSESYTKILNIRALS